MRHTKVLKLVNVRRKKKKKKTFSPKKKKLVNVRAKIQTRLLALNVLLAIVAQSLKRV